MNDRGAISAVHLSTQHNKKVITSAKATKYENQETKYYRHNTVG